MASTAEVVGFWIMVAGPVAGFVAWVVSRGKEPLSGFRVSVALTLGIGAPMLTFVGFAVWAIGNAGRPWPGYPMDQLLRWWGG